MPEKRIIELSKLVEKKSLDDLAKDIAFSSSIFMVFGLPTRKLKGHPESWVKKKQILHIDYSKRSW